MNTPVIKGASFVITHTPGLVRHGSKPTREIAKDETVQEQILANLRSYDDAVSYLPNQVFIGNMQPDALNEYERPWTDVKIKDAQRSGPAGEIVPEDEFYGWLKVADEFQLVHLEETFVAQLKEKLIKQPLIAEDLDQIGEGISIALIEEKLSKGTAEPLHINGDQLVGCVETGHEEDKFLDAATILENLSNKASGIIAMRHVLRSFEVTPEEVDYVFGCDEEAVGDRYQRGGGNIAKSIAEHAACINATGSDIKAFCCAPAHSVSIAAGLVQAGIYEEIVIVGGGSLAKLGMKFAGNIKNDMPIVEDQMGAISLIIGKDDGKSPVIRTDSLGKHEISAGSSAQAIYKSLIIKPLERLGKSILDIDKYAVELHNPDVTEPNGNGNVPRTNYRTIAAMAVLRGEMDKTEINQFEEKHGMTGFSPTQGHIASAIPFLGHARNMIMSNEISNAMFVGKGSLFLGKMTDLSDGMSFLIEKNEGVNDDA